MTLRSLPARAVGRYRRLACTSLFRNPVKMRNEAPIISFTFDDFPRSAYYTGGAILRAHGFRGTFYAAFGLAGTLEPVGKIFSREDLVKLVADGHELGCHTFGHCHSWNTAPAAFERSIIDNARRLHELLPEAVFKTLAYPLSGPRPNTKRRAARHFSCCRGGGQTYNAAVVDRGLLSAYFLEQAKHPDFVKRMIDGNADACGWLIFATHDVCETASPWGCTPGFLDDIVRYASRSGASVLPVGQAWDLVQAGRIRDCEPAQARGGTSIDNRLSGGAL
jgi:peptidoglycan/xylan/chitin deacetylase (PgdA/CDA1 family)